MEILNVLPLCLAFEQVFNYVLAWCGMSLIVGVTAKLLVPGENPHGTLPTFLIGFFASILTSLLLKFLYQNFFEEPNFNPIQVLTLVMSSVVGAFGLFLYRGMARFFNPR